MKRVEPRLDKYGFPIPPGFDELPRADGTPPQAMGDSRRLRSFLKLAVVVGILAAVCFHFDVGGKARGIFARFHAQKAEELRLRGDLDRALKEADQAVGWAPQSGLLLFIRGQIHFQRKDYDKALADVDTALAQDPNDERARNLQLSVLFQLKRHHEAAAAATEMIERHLGDRIEHLNSRAYSRALGKFELVEALADIDEVLTDSPDNGMYLDTRGYVLFQLGRDKEALADLSRAIELVEKERDQIELASKQQPLPAKAQELVARQMKAFDHHLAVMYHHRGEVHEQLGNADEAKKDLFIGLKLGFNPDEGVF
jgi:tetratricopeptide (TPR) repeat protein